MLLVIILINPIVTILTNCRDWVTQMERNIETSPTVDFISPSDLLRGEEINLRFEGKF